MRRLSFLLVLFLATAAVAQQSQPQLLEMTPRSGPSTGGTHVRIRISPFPNCPILPPPPTVSFGGVVAEDVTFPSEDWIVSTPPHAPGLVEVRITACGMEDIVIPDGFAYFQAPADGPFQVQTITPAFGPITGGTEVTIKVNEIPFCFDPVPPASVRFGGVDATNVREDFTANTITAVTPAHAAGAVDVSVTTCGGPTVNVGSGFTYINTDQNPNPAYEKVLFPVLFYGPGARGSQWATKISVYNAGQTTLTAANAVFPGDPACPAACGCGPTGDMAPTRTTLVCGAGFHDPAGLIFYAPKSAADELHYHSRVYDESRSTLNAGTEIPAVREREFRTDDIVLQDLPLDANFRLALRVYNPDQKGGAQVRMRVQEAQGVGSLGERVIDLTYPIVTIQPDPYPNRPAFAYLDLDPILRSLLGNEFGTTHKSVNLRLTPITEGIRFWAFASITNNETQLITTVTPQY